MAETIPTPAYAVVRASQYPGSAWGPVGWLVEDLATGRILRRWPTLGAAFAHAARLAGWAGRPVVKGGGP